MKQEFQKKIQKLETKVHWFLRNQFGKYFIDSYIISFPKSGRSWLNLVVWYYIVSKYGSRAAFYCNCSTKLPMPSTPCLRKDFPSIVLTHDPVNERKVQNKLPYYQLKDIFNPIKYEKTKNILLFRDPRDIVVSWFYQKTTREPLYTGSKVKGCPHDIDAFVKSDVFGIKKIVEWMNLWAPVIQSSSNYLVITYEDLMREEAKNFSKVIEYLAGNVSEAHLKIAIEEYSFSNMQKKELEELKKSRIVGNDEDINGKVKDALKARKGGVGGYKNELTHETIDYIENYVQKHLDPFYSVYCSQFFQPSQNHS